MIHLNCSEYDKYGAPILKNKIIEDYAKVVLKDFDPDCLKEPKKISIERFLDYYLGLRIEYHDIFCSNPLSPIIGAIAFDCGTLKVFDKNGMRVKNIRVRANTVVLDNCLKKPGQEGRALFTALHEAAHYLLHPLTFLVKPGAQMAMMIQIPDNHILYCSGVGVENFETGRGKRHGNCWREYQADYFASNIAMPDDTVKPFIKNVLMSYGITCGFLDIAAKNSDDLFIANNILPQIMMQAYGVSKQAATIKLKKLRFIRKSTRDYIPTQEELAMTDACFSVDKKQMY